MGFNIEDPFPLPEFWIDWVIKQESADEKQNITVGKLVFYWDKNSHTIGFHHFKVYSLVVLY